MTDRVLAVLLADRLRRAEIAAARAEIAAADRVAATKSVRDEPTSDPEERSLFQRCMSPGRRWGQVSEEADTNKAAPFHFRAQEL
jgi:hypothetical protein